MSVTLFDSFRLPVASGDWCLVHTKQRSESMASGHLSRQGYDVYLPLFKALRRSSEGMVMQRSPVFPRHVFFRPASAGQSIAPARSTLGVSHLVRFGAAPATVYSGLVGALRDVEQSREASDLAAFSRLKSGRRVAICAGPLKGLVSRLAGHRVTVLLDLLGRQPGVIMADHHREVLAA